METSITSPSSAGNIQGRARGGATVVANGSISSFSFAHGLTGVPSYANAVARNALTAGSFFVTVDGTNIKVTYLVAPPAGTLSFYWSAEL